MVTASFVGWIRDARERLHYKLDDYFDEGPRTLSVGDQEITNIHRTMSTYINAFLDAGFFLEGIKDSTPTREQAASFPKVADNLRVPEFVIYLLRKPGG